MCKNAAGETKQASVLLSVGAPSAPTLALSLSGRTLSWEAKEASTCFASGGWSGNQQTVGTTTITTVTVGTVYTLTCRGAGGDVMRGIILGSTDTTPSVMLYTPSQLVKEGSIATVSWEVGGKALCRGEGDWEGWVKENGSLTVGPVYEKRLYTLTCENAAGVVATSLVLMPTHLTYLPSDSKQNSGSFANVFSAVADFVAHGGGAVFTHFLPHSR